MPKDTKTLGNNKRVCQNSIFEAMNLEFEI